MGCFDTSSGCGVWWHGRSPSHQDPTRLLRISKQTSQFAVSNHATLLVVCALPHSSLPCLYSADTSSASDDSLPAQTNIPATVCTWANQLQPSLSTSPPPTLTRHHTTLCNTMTHHSPVLHEPSHHPERPKGAFIPPRPAMFTRLIAAQASSRTPAPTGPTPSHHPPPMAPRSPPQSPPSDQISTARSRRRRSCWRTR